MLPEDLKQYAVDYAKRTGRTLGQLIRDALQNERYSSPKPAREKDALFVGLETLDRDGPGDVAINHDDYLYDNKPL